MSETSAFGTKRTSRDVRVESVMRTKADITGNPRQLQDCCKAENKNTRKNIPEYFRL
jgi:hypothetical protein